MRPALRRKLDGGLEKLFEGGFARGYFFCVSEAFKRQLDIASTLNGATEGVCYSFELGDVFYDDRRAYELPWAEACKFVRHIVRIVEALPSSIIVEELEVSGKQKKVKKVADGLLKFKLVSKGIDGEFDFAGALEVQTNQFDFVEFLRTGKLVSANIDLPKA